MWVSLVLGDDQYKTDAPCHSRCGTLRNPHCSWSLDLGAEHSSTFSALHRQWCRLQMTNSRVGRKTPNKKTKATTCVLCFAHDCQGNFPAWRRRSYWLYKRISNGYIRIYLGLAEQSLGNCNSAYSCTYCQESEPPLLTWLIEIYLKDLKQFYWIIVVLFIWNACE